jgi:hypothetical protein
MYMTRRVQKRYGRRSKRPRSMYSDQKLFFEDGGKVPRDVYDAMDVVLVRQEIGKQITKTAAKLPVM